MEQLLNSNFILFLIYQMVPCYIMALEKVALLENASENDLNKQNQNPKFVQQTGIRCYS